PPERVAEQVIRRVFLAQGRLRHGRHGVVALAGARVFLLQVPHDDPGDTARGIASVIGHGMTPGQGCSCLADPDMPARSAVRSALASASDTDSTSSTLELNVLPSTWTVAVSFSLDPLGARSGVAVAVKSDSTL